MTHQYRPVQWNRKKAIYDGLLWLGIVVFVVLYVGISVSKFPADQALSTPIVLMRAFALCAFVMLTMILCIGPLCRLDSRFLPLLYNRRHLGVSMCVLALAHAILATIWYHGFGVESPLASIFTLPGTLTSFSDLPFQPFGFAALMIVLLMAATSHDYWNANLGPRFWKSLHMLVYVAYALVIAHLSTGALLEPNTGVSPALVVGSVCLVGGLHLISAFRPDAQRASVSIDTPWLDVGRWQDIPNDRALVVQLDGGTKVAIFRYDESKLAAVGNACKHQLGPLGEGRVINGCITCPWHGYQYRPEDGRSPPPYEEKIPTYTVKIDGDRVLLDPRALAEGTARDPAIIGVTS